MKITDFIFCDDIRQELKNKASLIGIYNSKITFEKSEVSSWPIGMKAAILFRLMLEGDVIDSFRLEITNCGIQPFTKEIKIDNPKEMVQVVLIFPVFPILKDERMNFNLTFLNNNKVVKEIKPAYAIDVSLI